MISSFIFRSVWIDWVGTCFNIPIDWCGLSITRITGIHNWRLLMFSNGWCHSLSREQKTKDTSPTEVLGHKCIGFVQFLPLVLMKMGQGMIILRHSLMSITMQWWWWWGGGGGGKGWWGKASGACRGMRINAQTAPDSASFGGKLTYVYLIEIQSQHTNITCKHKIQI